MSIVVYWISGSAPAWRVLLTLEIKGLSYTSHVLQTSAKEQKQAWFLELNPRGQNKEPKLAGDLGLASLDTDYPALLAGNNKVEDLPAFAATFPPHWKT